MIQGWGRSEALRAPLEVTSEGCCLQLMAARFLFTPHPLFKSPLWNHTFGVNTSLDWKGILRLQGRRKAPPIQQQLQKWFEAYCKEYWWEVWPSPVWANSDLQWEIPCRGPLLARAPTPAQLPGTFDVPVIILLLFQPFHWPKVRWKGSSSGSIPKIFVLSNTNSGNSSDKSQHIPVWPFYTSSCISICPGDAGVHLQCSARWELFCFTSYYKFLFTNYFLNILSGHIFFLLPF